ncbi:MAG: TetR family transcriptional regulator [Dehalococcoidia bacterium]|nr:TetR family transcriptional regulator [Dehalococcoidia bacterium]
MARIAFPRREFCGGNCSTPAGVALGAVPSGRYSGRMMETAEGSTRTRLLDATVAVLGRDGLHALTLEAVAAQAGVSKGGLLYHFPSKQQLVETLIRELIDAFAAEVEQRASELAGVRGRWSRAYLDTTDAEQDNAGRWLAALSAFATEPALLDPWRELASGWFERDVAEGADPVTVMSAILAADGLWVADVLGMQTLSTELRGALLARLREQLQGSAR